MKLRTPMKRVGKKTRSWESARRKLKIAFEAAGITRCELNYDECWRFYTLGFAHHRKRRNLKPSELTICILACNSCHDKLESQPEAEMERIVLETIDNRETSVILT